MITTPVIISTVSRIGLGVIKINPWDRKCRPNAGGTGPCPWEIADKYY